MTEMTIKKPSIKLTNQIIQDTINTGAIYIPFGCYALLYKKLPTYDEGLEEYIKKLNRLPNYKNVRVLPILDYYLSPDSTLCFRNGLLHASKGVLLEKRAKGVSFTDPQHVLLSSEQDVQTEDITRYITLLTNYLVELEKRASASQETYDELVEVLLALAKEDLVSNPKPGHVFFDSEVGYTLIDVLPKQPRGEKDKIPKDTFDAVFGSGMPRLQMDNQILNLMPFELQKRMINVLNVLLVKITLALEKSGFSKEEIVRAREEKLSELKIDTATDFEEMETYLSELQAEIRKCKERLKISSYVFK